MLGQQRATTEDFTIDAAPDYTRIFKSISCLTRGRFCPFMI